MNISIFDLFNIGIGPSSVHTVGPMKAANSFIKLLKQENKTDKLGTIKCLLYGSLAKSETSYDTIKAINLGLQGHEAHLVNTEKIADYLEIIEKNNQLQISENIAIDYNWRENIGFKTDKKTQYHPNALEFAAYNKRGVKMLSEFYYSIGSGFIVSGRELENINIESLEKKAKHEYGNAEELFAKCKKHNTKMWQIVWENEKKWHSEKNLADKIIEIWRVMRDSILAGVNNDGRLPGPQANKRRAAKQYKTLIYNRNKTDSLEAIEWVIMAALAVSEENAAGGKIVTALSNEAVGVIPAVLYYYIKFIPNASEKGVIEFLLTATAIGNIIKNNTRSRPADARCEKDIASACAMAAAGLAQVLGGSHEQIENAAELSIEHNMGMVCKPSADFRHLPCAESNAIAAVNAITAARIAVRKNVKHSSSLDSVIKILDNIGAHSYSEPKKPVVEPSEARFINFNT